MVDIFISYPQRERALMLPIKQRLEALGLILFVDVDGRLDGEAAFPDALDKGVRASKAVLGCWSPWALTREWVKNECAIGKDENKLVAVERVVLTGSDVPAEFYRVDRKPLSDFDGTAPHEGWAMTLSALATKLKLWVEKRPDHPEVEAVRDKIAVLEKAAAAERAALAARQPSRDSGATPRLVIASDAAERAWAAIEQSVEVAHYRRFERAFESDPVAFVRVIEAEARAKALERWAATDRQDADAIAETLRTGLFPALQEVAERALAAAPEAVRKRDMVKIPSIPDDFGSVVARLQGREPSEDDRLRLAPGVTVEDFLPVSAEVARWQAEGRIKIDAKIFHGDSDAAKAGWLKPGNGNFEWFKDLDIGPELVVVPSGEFNMGEGSRLRQVAIKQEFAIGRYTLTFSEWDAAQDHPDWEKLSGILPRMPDDSGWGRGRQPVINVSWTDAERYCKWLSAVTGNDYRLPARSEREYCCRAGTITDFWWGDSISSELANYNGNFTHRDEGKGVFRQRTVPVECFEPNPWGLFQVHGNVSEWCDDQHDWSSDRFQCGGCWNSYPISLRSGAGVVIHPNRRENSAGFRVARVLSVLDTL